jgi:hypothetical protein
MTIKNNNLIAGEGKEIYNISNPDIFGPSVTLGKNDKASNWDERDKIIIEEVEDEEIIK